MADNPGDEQRWIPSNEELPGSSAPKPEGAPGTPWVPPASVGATPPQPGGAGPVYERRGTNGFAIASLVLGILGLPILCPLLIPSVLAVIFGFIARKNIKETGEGGGGMALAGLITGFIGIVSVLLLIVAAIIFLPDADWDDDDKDDMPNFLDTEPNDPDIQMIRPILLAGCRAFSALVL